MKILITCPPMIQSIERYRSRFVDRQVDYFCPNVLQTLTEEELLALVADYDGWIIGDDPATRQVFQAGKKGRLRAAVKWGVGMDNVDESACQDLEIAISNTPQMFGAEVADVALGYVIALARQTFHIDRGVRNGQWPKPQGISLKGKKVALIGFGDIGQELAKRLQSCGMHVFVTDPKYAASPPGAHVSMLELQANLAQADFIVLTCALTTENRHLLNRQSFTCVKDGVRIVNVARGALIDEQALIEALEAKKVHSVGLDVFEQEPLPKDSPLRQHDRCIFGSHNSSNTVEAVDRTSHRAIDQIFTDLGVN